MLLRRPRLIPLLLALSLPAAHLQAQQFPNPLMMANPYPAYGNAGYGNAFGNPFAPAFGNSFGNPYGNPLGNAFGNPYGNPLAGLNTLGTLGSLGLMAAPLVAPLLLPQAPQPFAAPGYGQMGYPSMPMMQNPAAYGQQYPRYGSAPQAQPAPYAVNPFLRPAAPAPAPAKAAPAPFSLPAFTPSQPTLPLSPAQGTLPLPVALPVTPPTTPPAAPAAPQAFTLPPQLYNLPFLSGINVSPAPGLMPGLSPMPAAVAPQSGATPWSNAPAPEAAPAAAANPWSQQPEAQASAPVPSNPVAEQTLPIDPAAFMQMLMRPAEAMPAK